MVVQSWKGILREFEILRNEKGSAITKSLFRTTENSVLMMDVVGWERTVDASLGGGSMAS